MTICTFKNSLIKLTNQNNKTAKDYLIIYTYNLNVIK